MFWRQNDKHEYNTTPKDIDKRNYILNNEKYLKLHDLNFMIPNTSFLKQFYFYDRLQAKSNGEAIQFLSRVREMQFCFEHQQKTIHNEMTFIVMVGNTKKTCMARLY